MYVIIYSAKLSQLYGLCGYFFINKTNI